MLPRRSRSRWVWLPLVLAGLLLIYLPGLGNSLLFDDSYLSGGLFADYGSWREFAPRMLSYGSFVWLHALFGDGWWKQRLANVVIHAGVVVMLWGLYREILRCIEPTPAERGSDGAPALPYEESPALGLAIAFFALNPVAVYAVAYLIQRSILLATFFVTAGLWSFASGARLKSAPLLALSVACYALAVLSKEAAIVAPLAVLPLYVLVVRPPPRRLLMISMAGLVLVGVAAAILWQRYGQIIGKPFDEYSRAYLAQLARLDPDAPANAYGLSILNETWLFFRYGFAWMVPYSGWMSIDLRPPFPIHWLSFPQTLGAAGYLLVLAGGFLLVLRYRDWRALAGISLLFPALLFPTEFATVWVQDPFVLYRSYLWAIGIPGIVFLLAHGPAGRTVLVIGLAAGALLAWQALDRVWSMHDAVSAWTDAITKLPNDPRAVGRWFPYLNRGSAYVDANDLDLALQDFRASSALGDLGMGAFNAGAVLSAKGRQREALADFDLAERSGYNLYNLPFQRGLALLALGRREEALKQFEAARRLDPPSPIREIVLLQYGRTALELGMADDALDALDELARIDPHNEEGQYLLSMVCITKGDPARALRILDALLMERSSARAYYARALANYALKRKAEALADIENAMRGDPANANLRAWRSKIEAMP
ncbi:MAG TPA: tetratricopeptide repeat protein [Usitatibacter sp.]|nr:tetratricopeptide repeat protein [Usitatibacter sp.]